MDLFEALVILWYVARRRDCVYYGPLEILRAELVVSAWLRSRLGPLSRLA